MKKAILIGGGCVGLVLAAIAVRWAILKPAKVAAGNLAAINSISAGSTTEAELLRRKEFQTMPRTCIQESCVYYQVAQNALLSGLHLAPRTFIGTAVTVRDGLVTEVTVISSREGVRSVIIKQQQRLPDGCSADPCLRLPPPNSLVAVMILLDNQSDLRNHLPEAVNVECLSLWRGCRRYADLIPLAANSKSGNQ